MPDFKKRSNEIEVMDDLQSSGPVIDQTLKELEFINKWLGGNCVTLSTIKEVFRRDKGDKVYTIGDLGCGGGDMIRLIADWADKNNVQVQLIGIDANPNIVDYARKKNAVSEKISFLSIDIFSKEFTQYSFDCIIGTLFFHHFTDSQLIQFFSGLRRQVSKAIIINDIHRHPLAYYSIKFLTSLFSKSSMVKNDAPVSVMRAFRRDELALIVEAAGYKHYSIKWKWAFRWQVIIYP